MLRAGEHIRINRTVYHHHGIYVGNGRVVHYTGRPGAKKNAAVRETTIASFCQGSDDDEVETLDYSIEVTHQTVARRARRRIGERDYSVFSWNCEHFAYLCRTGEAVSPQAIRIARIAGGVAAVVAAVALARKFL